MTVEELQQKLSQFDKDFTVVVDLLGGPYPITDVYMDKKNKQVRFVVQGDEKED